MLACMAIVNKPRRNPVDGTWSYPATSDVLEEVGLYSIAHYIEVRRDTISNFIVHRPIFERCQGARRRRGTAPRQFWWDQSFDLGEGEGIARRCCCSRRRREVTWPSEGSCMAWAIVARCHGEWVEHLEISLFYRKGREAGGSYTSVRPSHFS